MPRPEALSASSIQLYANCSLKWRFQYWDRLPRLTVSVNQAFGTSMHAALNWLHRERKSGRSPQLTDLLRVFDGDWYAQTEVAGQQQLLVDDAGDVAVLAVKAHALLTDYFDRRSASVRDSELRFTLPIVNPATGEMLDVPLRGAIDLIEDDDVIVEFKAPQKAPPLTELPDNVQVTAYAYAFERLFGRMPKEIKKISFVRTKVPRIDVQITGREVHDLERLFYLARETLKGIRAEVFIPNRGCWLCSDCEYRQDCDEWLGNATEPRDVQHAVR